MVGNGNVFYRRKVGVVMKEAFKIALSIAAIIGTLAFVAGVCYEVGSFWTWQALRWLWGV